MGEYCQGEGGEPETETLHSEDLNEAVRRVEYAKESAAKIAEAEPPTDPWEKLATGIEKAEAPAKAPEIDQKILRDIRYRLKYAHEIEAPVAGIDAWLEAVSQEAPKESPMSRTFLLPFKRLILP